MVPWWSPLRVSAWLLNFFICMKSEICKTNTKVYLNCGLIVPCHAVNTHVAKIKNPVFFPFDWSGTTWSALHNGIEVTPSFTSTICVAFRFACCRFVHKFVHKSTHKSASSSVQQKMACGLAWKPSWGSVLHSSVKHGNNVARINIPATKKCMC